LKIENLEAFVKINKNRSFTKAAKECFCTQATISLRLKMLEDYLDVKLFDRIGRTIELTAEGEMILPHIQLVLNNIEETQNQISEFKQLSFGSISISSSNTPGTYILPNVIYQFNQAYPKIKLNSHITYAKGVIQEILFGKEYDFGLVSQPQPIDDKKIICQAVFSDRLSVITNGHHPWVRRKNIEISELLNETILLSNKATSLKRYISSFNSSRPEFDKEIILGSVEAVKKNVIRGMGISIISSLSVKDELSTGSLKEIELKGIELERMIYLLYRKNKILSPAAKAFIDLLLIEVEKNLI
jgi:DNA-binding transcriptional LysR family regulator